MAGRRGEERRVDLVAPPGDGDGLEATQVRLAVGHTQSARRLSTARPGSTISLKRSVMVPKGNFRADLHREAALVVGEPDPRVGPLGEHALAYR